MSAPSPRGIDDGGETLRIAHWSSAASHPRLHAHWMHGRSLARPDQLAETVPGATAHPRRGPKVQLLSAKPPNIPPLRLIVGLVIASLKVRQCGERVYSGRTQCSLPSLSSSQHQSASFESAATNVPYLKQRRKWLAQRYAPISGRRVLAGNRRKVVGHD
jgi:hypothetical protein